MVNFASGAGLFGNYGQCSYAAAKEGIRGLTRVAANEWGPDGINVNIVCPLAWTAALENFQDAYPEVFKVNVHMPPAGHYGDVEKEIGRVVVQLCGPDFKYMNGETVTLEGRMGQRPSGVTRFYEPRNQLTLRPRFRRSNERRTSRRCAPPGRQFVIQRQGMTRRSMPCLFHANLFVLDVAR